jgi:tetratricopeptide (TPR) repeat protein
MRITSIYRAVIFVGLVSAAFTIGFHPLLCLAQSSSTTANSNTGVIEGHVVLPSGNPINTSVRISLSTLNAQGVSIFTDNNGAFRFPRLPEGNYVLEINADPKVYKPIIENIRLIRNMHLNLRLNLEEKESETSKKPAQGTAATAEGGQDAPGPAKREYEQGAKLAERGDRAGAIEYFNKAIELFPSYVEALNDLGVQYLKGNDLEEAAERFSSAVDLSPTSFNPRLNLGIVLIRQHRFQEGMDHLSRAVSIDSSRPGPHLYLGTAALDTDDLAMAERELSKCLSLSDKEFSVAHYYKAQVHLRKGERGAALTELNAYLAASPSGEFASQAQTIVGQLKQ